MQTQSRICPHCKDDHPGPCSMERMARTLAEAEAENASLRAERKAVRAYARWLEAGKPETDAEAIANFERFLSEAGPPPAREGIASLRAELEAARACIRDALHLTPVVPDEDHWSWRHLEVVKAAREGKAHDCAHDGACCCRCRTGCYSQGGPDMCPVHAA